MSTTIQTLTDSIKARAAVVLGSGYSESGYGIDFLKNNKLNSNQVYSVLPGGMADSITITRSVTYDQRFTIGFSNTYINTSMSDANQQTVAIDSLELAKNLYKDLVDEKCGSPTICLNVTSLEIEDPIHVVESKMVIIEMSILVKYRELI